MTTELDAVRDTRPSVAAPSDEARSAARRRLTAAIADEPPGLYEHRHRAPFPHGFRATLARVLIPRSQPDNGALRTGNEVLDPRHRRWVATRGVLLPVVSLLVVAAVVAVVVLAGHNSAGLSSATGARPVTLIYRAEATPAQPRVTPRALERTVSIIRSRARQLGVSHVQIHTRGTNEIVVKLAAVHNLSLAENALGSNAEPEVYDWEANVLLPSGTSAASSYRSRTRPPSGSVRAAAAQRPAPRAPVACRSMTRSSWPPVNRTHA
jgi:hypothetical protein